MEDITTYIHSLLEQFCTVDIAEAEFKMAIADDDELRSAYRQWCDEQGYSEKHGFRDYCEEYIASQNEIWDTLTEYGEDDL